MSEDVEECELEGREMHGFMYEDMSTCERLYGNKETFAAAVAMLPQSVLNTGITPIRTDDPVCQSAPQPTDFDNSTSLNNMTNSSTSGSASSQEMAEKALVNLDCYAYLTVSPFTENTISTTGLTVPRGIGFSGKLNVLDRFEAAGEGLVRCWRVNALLFLISTPANLTLPCRATSTRTD